MSNELKKQDTGEHCYYCWDFADGKLTIKEGTLSSFVCCEKCFEDFGGSHAE